MNGQKPIRFPNGITVQAPTLCDCGRWHICHLDQPRPVAVAVGRRIKETGK